MKTLPHEPWRGGQICGYQSEYGVFPGRTVQCGEFKALGLYHCQEHHDWVAMDGPIQMAEGNALGLELKPIPGYGWGVYDVDGDVVGSNHLHREPLEEIYGFTLKWEGADGKPVDPTDDELRAFEES